MACEMMSIKSNFRDSSENSRYEVVLALHLVNHRILIEYPFIGESGSKGTSTSAARNRQTPQAEVNVRSV